jgi:hypothetical protein
MPRPCQRLASLGQDRRIVDRRRHAVAFAIGDARIVPRRILPDRVFGRRLTTSAALKRDQVLARISRMFRLRSFCIFRASNRSGTARAGVRS